MSLGLITTVALAWCAAIGLLVYGLLTMRHQMIALAGRAQRLEGRIGELELLDAARQKMDANQRSGEAVVQGGVATVQLAHKGIAAIPFSILEAIPATRDTTRVVRAVHDSVSGKVYGSLLGSNKLIGRAFRGLISGPGRRDHTDED